MTSIYVKKIIAKRKLFIKKSDIKNDKEIENIEKNDVKNNDNKQNILTNINDLGNIPRKRKRYFDDDEEEEQKECIKYNNINKCKKFGRLKVNIKDYANDNNDNDNILTSTINSNNEDLMNSNNALFNHYDIRKFNYDNKINASIKDEIRSEVKNEIGKENNELFNV